MSHNQKNHEEEYIPTQEQEQLKSNFRIIQERIDSIFEKPEEGERRRRAISGTIEHFVSLIERCGPEHFFGEGCVCGQPPIIEGGNCTTESSHFQVSTNDHTLEWRKESDWLNQESGSEHGETI